MPTDEANNVRTSSLLKLVRKLDFLVGIEAGIASGKFTEIDQIVSKSTPKSAYNDGIVFISIRAKASAMMCEIYQVEFVFPCHGEARVDYSEWDNLLDRKVAWQKAYLGKYYNIIGFCSA